MLGALITLTLWAWLAFEIGLLVRDRRRGMGGSSRDRGTKNLNFVTIIVAVLVAEGVARLLRDSTVARLPGPRVDWHPYAGLAVMWAGLALRIWAIVVLGRSFRMTVEVDTGQTMVDRGPYRWVRHPSYTGLLLLSIGFGMTLGNWISLAITLLLPLAALLRRITVEETELANVLGQPYQAYRERTKRLVPGIW